MVSSLNLRALGSKVVFILSFILFVLILLFLVRFCAKLLLDTEVMPDFALLLVRSGVVASVSSSSNKKTVPSGVNN